MTFILKDSYFNPDEIDIPVIGIASDLAAHDSGLHSHQKAQLLYAPSGCMTVTSAERQYILPPNRAFWIPANTLHRVIMRNVVAYRSIYFDIHQFSNLPGQLQLFNVNGLFKELIERVSFWEWDRPFELQQNILHVFLDELNNASTDNLVLTMPKDLRVQSFVEQWNKGESMPPFLKEFSKLAAASEKTITRIFIKETGMPYQDWRQQWRLHKAIELLAEGRNVGETAFDLEFSSDSAFIDFFKKHLGETPSKYFPKTAG
ncbi:AraC-like DNA-binding protein [Pedobacter cryoconitis]|uniref:AraC-like DNA-binding protein n=1 Tax=Pedobacter cryoconitis TaxID=188932 RepID=A0A7W8ZQC8_9SPHI|nr:helix-turn-helix transcriptional regulator [Pedobacter cryoconitis]MBB5638113.1 AraC-like DNA-binding protein [Pedobacter cryoconitis]